MASRKAVPVAVANNGVDLRKDNQGPTKLCMFMEPLSAVDTLERTLRYAQKPEQYLKESLGDSVVESKRALLSIPGEVTLDAYGTGTHKQAFERHIAKLLGKKEGLFFLTGVQAQLAALKIYCERSGREKVAWHVSSHLESSEQKAYKDIYGLERVLLGSTPEALATVKEIRSALDVPERERPAAILLEIPNRVLGCQSYTFPELQEISSACNEANVALHCDGARLWEIEPYYVATASASFAQLGALFDSVYVSFYKGLRGITGAMLVHNDALFIAEAKAWQRRAGGNSFTQGYELIDCERGFNVNIGTFSRKRDKMVRIVDAITAATDGYKNTDGKPIVGFTPPRATCCQTVSTFSGYTEAELTAARDRVQDKMNVRVFERLRDHQTLDEKLAKDAIASVPSDKAVHETVQQADGHGKVESRSHSVEWMIMSVTEQIDDAVFVDAYVALSKELLDKAV